MKFIKDKLKEYFETGDKPTQEQYAELIDSLLLNKQEEGVSNRRFVIDETGEVTVTSEQKTAEYTLSDITNNKLSLLKDGVAVKEIDLSSLQDESGIGTIIAGKHIEVDFNIHPRKPMISVVGDFKGEKGDPGQDGIDGKTLEYQAGNNISIDTKNPLKPIINATGGSGGTTDLSYNTLTRTLASSSGNNVVLPLADATNAGLQKANFYEEGTFTPVILGGNYTINGAKTGRYIRIGNKVTAYYSLGSIEGNGTSGLALELPIPTTNDFFTANTQVFSTGNGGTSLNKVEVIRGDATRVFFLEDGTTSTLSNINFVYTGSTQSSGGIVCSITYFTTD